MKAAEVLKIAQDAQPKPEETRLNKYIGFLERDLLFAARLGKFTHKVNYSDRAINEEFIFKIQEHFLSNDFEIITAEDPTKYREFIISWKKDE